MKRYFCASCVQNLREKHQTMDDKRNRLPAYLPVILALILIAGMYLGFKLAPVSTFNNSILNLRSEKYNKINDIIGYIEQDYVDSVNRKTLTRHAIHGILEKLDPHSQYIPAHKLTEINEHLMGNFEGIGIQFRIEKDTIMVMHTIADGPSEKAGIMPGDRIVKINDSLIAGPGISNNDAIRLLKGPSGTRVDVSIYRRGLSDMVDVTITRGIVPSTSLDFAYMINDSSGYIKLTKFSATTYEEFSEALDTLIHQGMTQLILDLRGNTGGYLGAAIRIADEFLEENKLIVYTKGKNRPKNFSHATKKGRFEDGEVVVLIDEHSASASEIIAGAIQDNDRGIIIGRRSFGKGLVQEQLNLPDGSAVRLTVARYYTPTGRCIQRPYDQGTEAYYKTFYERYTNGEMIAPDSIHFNDSLKFITPSGKVVYGGGGIMPDIYVPLRAEEHEKYLNQLMSKGLIYQFALEYTDQNRSKLQMYADGQSFRDNFKVSNAMINALISYADRHGVTEDPKGLQQNKNRIRLLLKSFIGRTLIGNEGFYPVYHKVDRMFLRAKEVIS